MSKEQTKLLHDLYYKKGMLFGRDKLYKYIQTNHDDMKISRRQVAEWLSKQEIQQLYKKHEEAKDIKSTVLKQPHIVLGIDLVDMQNIEQKGIKYLLNGVDLFSRKLYSIPLKNKEAESVKKGFMLLLKKVKNIKAIRSDNGSEFISDVFKDFLKSKNIKQVLSSPHNPQSNGGIERFNQTLKQLINKQLELKDGYNWVLNLQKLVDNINNTIIDGINKTPNEIEKNPTLNELVHEKDKKIKANSISKQKYKVGDDVRIYIKDDGKWSNDIYKIDKVLKPKNEYSVYEYKLKDDNKKYFEEDLQKIIDVQNRIDVVERFEISKFVRPVVKNNKEHYEIAWKGYRKKSDNTIEPRSQLLKDAPKMLHQYEKKINWKRDRNNKLYFNVVA